MLGRLPYLYRVKSMFAPRFASLSIVLLLAALQPAIAADNAPVSVKVNMARIVKINSPAATVIVGNPGVADVTIQDPQTLVLTGKSYGQTNLIVLDNVGNAIADTVVNVVQDQGDLVTMYMGETRQTIMCAPKCQPMLMLGDDAGYTSTVQGQAQVIQQSASPR
jgi:Flp pilus assembly secretin CpaC